MKFNQWHDRALSIRGKNHSSAEPPRWLLINTSILSVYHKRDIFCHQYNENKVITVTRRVIYSFFTLLWSFIPFIHWFKNFSLFSGLYSMWDSTLCKILNPNRNENEFNKNFILIKCVTLDLKWVFLSSLALRFYYFISEHHIYKWCKTRDVETKSIDFLRRSHRNVEPLSGTHWLHKHMRILVWCHLSANLCNRFDQKRQCKWCNPF